MTRFKLYKHDYCTDVAFYPRHVFYVKEKHIYKVDGWWWNISTVSLGGKPWNMGIKEHITIKREDMKYWGEING